MPMTKTRVLALLKENQDERGMAHWNKRPEKTGNLKSFGIGLTRLRKMAKEIGRDHTLAGQLWKSNVYEAKVLGLLIDEPKLITRAQAESQVEQLQGGLLSHVFASCDATLAKTPFAFEVMCDWMESKDPVRRRCGFALAYELSKKKTVKGSGTGDGAGMDDAFCLERIAHIENAIHGEEMWVRESMAGALLGMGKRNKKLNKAAIRAAKAIGPLDVDYGKDNSCEPIDLLKHLTSDYLKKKLAG
jgi:DNA alkylation repair enzyme